MPPCSQINRHANRSDLVQQLLARSAAAEEGTGRRSVGQRALESLSGHALPVHGITVSLQQLALGSGEARGLAAGLLQGVPSLQFLLFAADNQGLDIVDDAVTLYHCAGIRYTKRVGLAPEGRILRANPSWYNRPRFDTVMVDT